MKSWLVTKVDGFRRLVMWSGTDRPTKGTEQETPQTRPVSEHPACDTGALGHWGTVFSTRGAENAGMENNSM